MAPRLTTTSVLRVLVVILTCTIIFADPKAGANDSSPAPKPAPSIISLAASATNASPGFRKYLYSFPLASPALLIGLSGSISITSHGQGFSQALISIHYIPAGHDCPRDGEVYGTYSAIRARYPAMQPIADYIIKQPAGSSISTMPIQLTLPAGIPVSGCLVFVLDGSVRLVGGAFTMASHLNAHLVTPYLGAPAAKPVLLDDEFCFGRATGGQRATTQTSPQAAFMRVIPITEPMTLLALYGDVSDSTFGPGSPSPGPGPWAVANDYYVYPHCTLRAGNAGLSDFYATIPANGAKLYSLAMQGSGQVTLQQPVFKAFTGMVLHPGDALVHLVRITHASDQGGIDAENQVFALVRPFEKTR